MKSKDDKRKQAMVRQAEFDKLTPAQKEARQTGKARGKYVPD